MGRRIKTNRTLRNLSQIKTQGSQKKRASFIDLLRSLFRSSKSRTSLPVVSEQKGTLTEEAIKPAESVKPVSQMKVQGYNILLEQMFVEAEGEPLIGQVAVGAVVLNRKKSRKFPNTIEKVILQRGQFCRPVHRIERAKKARETNSPAWQNIVSSAERVLQGEDPTGGATFFWNPDISTSGWFKNAVEKGILVETIRIGRHVFYKERG